MCDDPQLPGAFSPPAHEQRILKAVLDVMARQDPHLMHALCAWVEQRALPALSEPSILVLAKTIEEQHPWMLQAIPALDRRRESLHRMHAVAQAFRADNLARVRGHLDDQLERT